MDLGLDIRDLELLEALDEVGTLTAAAERLFVSQPALSQRLVKLEKRLGGQLFDRQGRRLVPNPSGKRLAQAARVTLAELRDATREVNGLLNGPPEIVRVWSQCATTHQWLPGVLRAFRRHRPLGEVVVEALDDGDDHLAALADGRLDIALVSQFDQNLDRVSLTPLYDDELVALVRSGHPLAGRGMIDPEDIAAAHVVLCDYYDPTRVPAVALPLPVGAVPAKLSTVPVGTDLLVEMIKSSDAMTILPSGTTAELESSGEVIQLRIGPVPEVRTWYCATAHRPQPAQVDAFIDTLIAELRGNGRRTAPAPRRATFA